MKNLLMLIVALALVAAGCNGEVVEVDDDEASPSPTPTEEETAAPVEEDEEEEEEEEDVDPEQRLNDAADATLEQGTTSYAVVFGDGIGQAGGTDARTDTDTGNDDDTDDTQTTDEDDTTDTDAGTDMTTTDKSAGTDSEDEAAAEGEADFDQDVRRITLQGDQAASSEVIIEGTTVYVPSDMAPTAPAADDNSTQDDDDDNGLLDDGDENGENGETDQAGDWVSFDLNDVTDEDGSIDLQTLLVFESPEATIEMIRNGADVTSAGNEDVDGQQAERFTLTAKADQLEGDIIGQLGDHGVTEVDVEVWIDEEDLIRRISLSYDQDGRQQDDAAGNTVVWNFTDFGQELDIEVPDDAEELEAEQARRVLTQLAASTAQPGRGASTGMSGQTDTGDVDTELDTDSDS